MKIRLLLLLVVFAIASCKKDVEIEKLQNKQNKTFKKDILATKKGGNFAREVAGFEMIYEYNDEESMQIIGITRKEDNKIKFHLLTETLPCDTEFWGIAIDDQAGLHPEMGEDENSVFPSRAYVIEEKQYLLTIRLATDFSKTSILYTHKDSLHTDCLPIKDVVMKRVK